MKVQGTGSSDTGTGVSVTSVTGSSGASTSATVTSGIGTSALTQVLLF